MALGYLISPAFQCVNENGKPLVGGTLRVVLHGTTIPYITYRDFDGNLNHEYVPLDAKGMAVIIADDSTVYDVYCYDLNRVQQWSRLNVSVGGGEGGGGSVEYSAGDGIAIENNEISAKVDGTTITVNEDGELEAVGGGGSPMSAGDGIDISDGKVRVDLKPRKGLDFSYEGGTFTADVYQGYVLGTWGYMGVGPLHHSQDGYELTFTTGNHYLAWNIANGTTYKVFAFDPQDTTKYGYCSLTYAADFYDEIHSLVGIGCTVDAVPPAQVPRHYYSDNPSDWTFVGGFTADDLETAAFGIYFPGTTGTSPMGTDFAAFRTWLVPYLGHETLNKRKLEVKVDGSSIGFNADGAIEVLGGGGSTYTAGPGISIVNSAISGDFVNQPPAGAHSSGTFPQVSDSVYTITQDDLTNGWINLRLADIRPADAVAANVDITFQVFLNNIHWVREDPQTQITPGDNFTCSVEFSIADKTTPTSWVSSTYVSNITWTWGSQTITDKKAVAFADGPASADFVDTFPQLSIYMPTELRNALAVGDELHLEGFIFAIPSKYRLSLV